jgi:hypothetical protein
VQSFLRNPQHKHGKLKYSLAESGLSVEAIHGRFAEYREQFSRFV